MIEINNPWFGNSLYYDERVQWINESVSLYDTAICGCRNSSTLYSGSIIGITQNGVEVQINPNDRSKYFRWECVRTIVKREFKNSTTQKDGSNGNN